MRTIPSCLLTADTSRYQTYYLMAKSHPGWFTCKFLPPGFIPEFKLSAKPVTVAIWNEYCQCIGSDDIRTDDPSLPITEVFQLELMPSPYEDAAYEFNFCDWVTLITGYKVTLPTATQFQYALCAGDTRSYVYPWGFDYIGGFPNTLASVDRTDLVYCNNLGLSDMVGNIDHCCADHIDMERAYEPCFLVKCGWGYDPRSWEYFNCAFDTRTIGEIHFRMGFRLCSNPVVHSVGIDSLSAKNDCLTPNAGDGTISQHTDWRVKFPVLAEYLNRMCDISGNTFVFGIPVEETIWIEVEDWEDFLDNFGPITKRVSLYHPARNVTLSNYTMSESPVTVALWREYCTATGREMPRTPSWGWVDDYPIEVSWYDAMGPFGEGGFCAWASQVSGYALTLPTEAQFEYASSGGHAGMLYPWGNEFSDKLLWCSNRKQRAAPAGVNRTSNIYRNAFGLVDLCGNVGQWCLDGFVPYLESDVVDPVGPHNGNDRTVRSSSYKAVDPNYMRRYYRSSGDKYRGRHGFRLVLNEAQDKRGRVG
jgi:formylglycine-generating enzyme required for sulfatase activity